MAIYVRWPSYKGRRCAREVTGEQGIRRENGEVARTSSRDVHQAHRSCLAPGRAAPTLISVVKHRASGTPRRCADFYWRRTGDVAAGAAQSPATNDELCPLAGSVRGLSVGVGEQIMMRKSRMGTFLVAATRCGAIGERCSGAEPAGKCLGGCDPRASDHLPQPFATTRWIR